MSEQKNNENMEETQVMEQAEPAEGDASDKASAVKVRPKEKAGEAIRKELAAKGVWHTDNEVEDALDALYAAYEADGTVPTREAFAAACGNAEAGRAVAEMKDDPFVRKSTGKRIAAIAAVVVLVAVCAGAAVIALQPGGSLPAAGSGSSISEKADDSGSKPTSSTKADDDEDADEEQEAEGEPDGKVEDGAESAGGTASGQQDGGGDAPAPESPQSQGGGTTGGAATGGAAQSKPSGGSTGGAATKPSQPSQPQHTHTWVEQTTQQWVPNNVWVVDQAAWDEVVPGRTYVQCSCGAVFNNDSEWAAHSESAALAGDFNHSYTVLTENTTVHHDEVGHWEDHGYNQTIVTGYVCSGCGATK